MGQVRIAAQLHDVQIEPHFHASHSSVTRIRQPGINGANAESAGNLSLTFRHEADAAVRHRLAIVAAGIDFSLKTTRAAQMSRLTAGEHVPKRQR